MAKLINIIYDFWDKWCRYRYVDPIFSFARLCLVTGAGLSAGGASWAITAFVPKLNIPVSVEFGPQQPIFLGTFLIVVGLCIGFWRIHASSNKIGCFLIDHRGMPGMELGDPQNDLPGRFKTAQLRHIRIDYSADKNEMLRLISTLNDRLKQDLNDSVNGKADLVYAGLAPIPFLFYAGKVISSRKQCKMILDWDRHSGRWHEPDGPRQNLSFVIEKPTGPVAEDLAIAMPISVEFGDGAIRRAADGAPIMWLKLPVGASQDSLSSKYDQQSLSEEFYNILAGLRGTYLGLKRVHLFIAAQASFVFYLGQQYSTTVHPPVNVYSFKGIENKYDWMLVVDGQAKLENVVYSSL